MSRSKSSNKRTQKTKSSRSSSAVSDDRVKTVKQSSKKAVKKHTKKDLQGAPNVDTFEAGLTFNVNHVRSGMRTMFENSDQVKFVPKFSGSHFAITACLEKMTFMLLTSCAGHLRIGKDGLKTIHRPTLMTVLLTMEEFKRYFEYKIRYEYKEDRDYIGTVPLELKKGHSELGNYISKIDDAIKLSKAAQSLLNFCVGEVFMDLVNTSYSYLAFARGSKGGMLKPRAVIFAVENLFHPRIAKQLRDAIKDVIGNLEAARPKDTSSKTKASGQKRIDSEDDDDESDDEDMDNEEDIDGEEEISDEEMLDDDVGSDALDSDEESELSEDDDLDEMDDDELGDEYDENGKDEEDDDKKKSNHRAKKGSSRKGTRNSKHKSRS